MRTTFAFLLCFFFVLSLGFFVIVFHFISFLQFSIVPCILSTYFKTFMLSAVDANALKSKSNTN